MPVRDPANDALCLQLAEPLQGKDQVDVTERVRAVVRPVRDRELPGLRAAWNDPERGVALELERAVVAQVDAGRGDQGDGGLPERSPQWTPRDGV